MPRSLRIEYEGASYHVMARANRGKLFQTLGDESSFLATLAEAQEKNGWIIHAWVLMSTHYHLLLETPEPNLVNGMKWLQGTYTQRYNAFHNTRGHLFQGRYKAKIIEPDDPAYFLKVSDYIHLNPAVAGLLSTENPKLESYTKSSYPAYLQSAKRRPSWLTTTRVLAAHDVAQDTQVGRKVFKSLMQIKTIEALEKKSDPEWLDEQKRMARGWVHGCKDFRKEMINYLMESREFVQVYDGNQRHEINESSAEIFLKKAFVVVELNPDNLENYRKGDPRKLLLAGCLRKYFSVTRKWITERLFMGHENRVTVGTEMYRNTSSEYIQMRDELEKIVKLSD